MEMISLMVLKYFLDTNPLVPDEQEFFDIKISDKNIEVNIFQEAGIMSFNRYRV